MTNIETPEMKDYEIAFKIGIGIRMLDKYKKRLRDKLYLPDNSSVRKYVVSQITDDDIKSLI